MKNLKREIREIKTRIRAEKRELASLRELRSSCGKSINTDMLDLEISALEDDIISLKANLEEIER